MKDVRGGFEANLFWTPIALAKDILEHNLRMRSIFMHQSVEIIVLISIALIFGYRHLKIRQETYKWLLLTIGLAFLMSYLARPIWQASSILQTIQFPWRFLQIFSFGGAVLCAIAIEVILERKSVLKYFLASIIVLILTSNFYYSYQLSRQFPTFHNLGRGVIPQFTYWQNILYKPYNDNLIDVKEYRPLLEKNSSIPLPIEGQPKFSLLSGKAAIDLEEWSSYQRLFKVNVEKHARIRIRTYYYPAWHLYVNNLPARLMMADDGTLKIDLPPGLHQLKLRYQWTPAFQIGIALSIFSLIILCLSNSKNKIKSISNKLVKIT